MQPDEQTRRDWIGSCAVVTAGMAGLAGCMGGSDDENGSDDSSTGDETEASGSETGEFGAWPMVRYNAANRLATPHDGIDGEPELAWLAEFEGWVHPPVVYDDVAFVGHGDDTYSAVDLHDGAVLWDHETPTTGVPTVTEDAVYVPGDGVEALDRENGEVRWTTEHESVRTLRSYDGELYVGLEDEIAVLDPDGEEQLSFETRSRVHGIALDDDGIYVRSLVDRDELRYALVGYDRETGEERWEHELEQESVLGTKRARTMPVHEGAVYTVASESVVRIDATTGDLEEVVEFEHISSRPTIHDGMVTTHISMERYDIETGEQLDVGDNDTGLASPPVHAGGSYYGLGVTVVLEGTDLFKIDADSMTVDSRTEAPSEGFVMHTTPVVLDGLVLTSIDDHGLAAFE